MGGAARPSTAMPPSTGSHTTRWGELEDMQHIVESFLWVVLHVNMWLQSPSAANVPRDACFSDNHMTIIKPKLVCQAVPALCAGALWRGRPAARSPRREHAAGGHAPPGRVCLLHVPDGGAGECLGARRCRVKAQLHSRECTPSFVVKALPLAAKHMCHG